MADRVEFIELLNRLTPEDLQDLLKAAKIIRAVSTDKSAQMIDLQKSGFTLDQIAHMWGVSL